MINIKNIVHFKSVQDGLQLYFKKDTKFEDIKSALSNQLNSNKTFFLRGTKVLLPQNKFNEEQIKTLRQIFHKYGLIYSSKSTQPKSDMIPTEEKSPSTKAEDTFSNLPTMSVINRIIRNGEEIRVNSSVLICGNVNPGAQIIASGSIDVRGTCRGIVHAGALGDRTAFVIADKLIPSQIRIADLVARAPDDVEQTTESERAIIKNDKIIFEPIGK